MIVNCPVCGKLTCIHWPEHWVYRRGSTYYCGEHCMDTDLYRDMQLLNEVKRRRKGRKQPMNKKDYTELARDVVKLKEAGVKNAEIYELLISKGYKDGPSAYMYIKEWCRKYAPDLYEKMKPEQKPKGNMTRIATREKPATAGDAMIAAKDIADVFFGKCEDMGLNLGKEEAPTLKPVEKIVGPCHIEKFLITAIKHPELGEFYYDKKFQKVDWRTDDGDEISMSPNGWQKLLNDLPHVLRILGAGR